VVRARRKKDTWRRLQTPSLKRRRQLAVPHIQALHRKRPPHRGRRAARVRQAVLAPLLLR